MTGLRRAFLVAGARTLVMSLWPVPDEECRLLMLLFYEAVLAGRPCGTALREAQSAVRQRFADPLAWGGFVCIGDPGPLD
jgi:CHAT domain-containing protein